MRYETVQENARIWVTHDGRLIGGYATNELRSYVFPFYSPQGGLVIQESPPDHPHHQGIWAGLNVDGYDLWNAGSFDVPRHKQELRGGLEAVSIEVGDEGAALSQSVSWVSVEGEDVLRERREVAFAAAADCNRVSWKSTFFHPSKRCLIGQTKESGLGVRVPPHWESQFGGVIRNRSGDTGESACFDSEADWLSIEGRALGDAVGGIVLYPTSGRCPWFTRDYGCHVYNPARHGEIELAPGDELVWSMTVLAYDGHRAETEIEALVRSV